MQVVTNDRKEIVEPLLKAFKDRDSEIANRASQCAIALTNLDAIDYLCRKWAKTRDKLLEQVLCQGKYVARQPIEARVLTALKTDQRQAIASDNEKIIAPLLQALHDSDRIIATEANALLGELKNKSAIDALCIKWSETRGQHLTEALQKGKYVATKPVKIKVLTALKSGRLAIVTDGSSEIVEPLIRALEDKDSNIANNAQIVLRDLKNPEAQSALCCLAIKQNHQLACVIAVNSRYTPRDSSYQALFYFLTEQWDKYENLDFEHTFLQTAFKHGDEELRRRITEQIRKVGHVELVKVLTGGNQKKRLREMTDTEWETTLAVLSSSQQWEEMWKLAQKAPPIWSQKLLQQLNQSTWLPKVEQEKAGFEKLKQLSNKCKCSDKISSMAALINCHKSLTGHTDKVCNISFSSDGRLIASSSFDKTIKLWKSAIYLPVEIYLSIEQLCQQKIEWVQKTLQGYEISKEERHWLEFIQGLMDWYRRFDVEVEDAPQSIRTSEFDIEIER